MSKVIQQGDRSRSGIALIIVLGFLSVLVIMAVGFAIAMRTERMAARNFADVARARQLVQVGLTRAMDEIESNLSAPPPLIYPPWDAFASTSSPPAVSLTNIIVGDATNFIPRSIWQAAQAAAPTVVWTNIVDPESGQLIGRFAYLALNCSGLLDASSVGANGVPRNHGTNVNEITVAYQPELNGPSIPSFFTSRATNWIRFESIPDLWVTCGFIDSSWKSYPSNFFIYSHFPPDKISVTSVLDKIDIGGDDVALQTFATQIIAGLQACNITNAAATFNNLLDYVDADSVPRDVDSACTEIVPMINEIVISNYYTATPLPTGGSNYVNTVEINIETWYPFTNSPSPQVDFAPPQITWFGYVPAPGGGKTPDNSLNPDPAITGTGPTVTPAGPFTQGAETFHVTTFKYTAAFANYPNQLYAIDVTITNLTLTLSPGAQPVDRVNGPLPTYSFAAAMGNLPRVTDRAISCVDPKVNWSPGHWVDGIAKSLNASNRFDAIAAKGISLGEGVSEMYVRNSPLQSAAELGYLSIGSPWRTISLYNGNGVSLHPVLNYFRAGPLPTNSYEGLVNIGTTNISVLASVLVGTTIEKYPGRAVVTNLLWTNALQIAGFLSAVNSSPTITNLGISQIGMPAAAYSSNTFPFMSTDARRESLIRNSLGLFGARQNLFTIFVAAQSMDAYTNPVAEQRAVAVVWRDPYLNANTNHVSFVRFFKTLPE